MVSVILYSSCLIHIYLVKYNVYERVFFAGLFFKNIFLFLLRCVEIATPFFYYLYRFCPINTCCYRLKKEHKRHQPGVVGKMLSVVLPKQVLNLKKMTPRNAMFVLRAVKNAFPNSILLPIFFYLH